MKKDSEAEPEMIRSGQNQDALHSLILCNSTRTYYRSATSRAYPAGSRYKPAID
ncbi:hypothetical protein [Nostoc sp.]|uniref:hypothetical protein n=1 Tax=Nostoc sp. TaxID=1180 RepID=UPI002FF70BEE